MRRKGVTARLEKAERLVERQAAEAMPDDRVGPVEPLDQLRQQPAGEGLDRPDRGLVDAAEPPGWLDRDDLDRRVEGVAPAVEHRRPAAGEREADEADARLGPGPLHHQPGARVPGVPAGALFVQPLRVLDDVVLRFARPVGSGAPQGRLRLHQHLRQLGRRRAAQERPRRQPRAERALDLVDERDGHERVEPGLAQREVGVGRRLGLEHAGADLPQRLHQNGRPLLRRSGFQPVGHRRAAHARLAAGR